MVFYIVQFFSGKTIKISLLSSSFLTMSFSFLLLLFLIISKANYDFFRSFFLPKTIGMFRAQSIALIFVVICGFLSFYLSIINKKKIYLWGYFLLLSVLLILAISQRANDTSPKTAPKMANLETKKLNKNIYIIGLEGMSFDFIIPLVNEGKLPNFSWLMDEGCWGRLENFSPSSPIVLNHSFNTGKFPAKHRQLSSFRYSLFIFNLEIEVVPRFILFWQMRKIGLLQVKSNPTHLGIKNIWKIFENNRTTYLKKDNPPLLKTSEPNSKAESSFNFFFKDLRFETSHIFNIAKQAFFSDIEFEEKVHQEIAQSHPQFVYFTLKGLNTVETYFYKYSFPDLFGNIDQEELSKYGTVIEKYYQFYDQIIGKYLTTLKENDLLIVCSPYGIDPLPLWKRFIERILGDPYISAYNDSAPKGVAFFYGKDIIRGKNIEGLKLIDIAPTLLNFVGLPVSKDMDGVVNSSVFKDEFNTENPIMYISSYEDIDFK